eukprot:1085689_1
MLYLYIFRMLRFEMFNLSNNLRQVLFDMLALLRPIGLDIKLHAIFTLYLDALVVWFNSYFILSSFYMKSFNVIAVAEPKASSFAVSYSPMSEQLRLILSLKSCN